MLAPDLTPAAALLLLAATARAAAVAEEAKVEAARVLRADGAALVARKGAGQDDRAAHTGAAIETGAKPTNNKDAAIAETKAADDAAASPDEAAANVQRMLIERYTGAAITLPLPLLANLPASPRLVVTLPLPVLVKLPASPRLADPVVWSSPAQQEGEPPLPLLYESMYPLRAAWPRRRVVADAVLTAEEARYFTHEALDGFGDPMFGDVEEEDEDEEKEGGGAGEGEAVREEDGEEDGDGEGGGDALSGIVDKNEGTNEGKDENDNENSACDSDGGGDGGSDGDGDGDGNEEVEDDDGDDGDGCPRG